MRQAVNEKDAQILTLLVILQHILTTIVLLVCAALVGCSIWLLTRPQPLSIIVKPPVSNDSTTGDLLVDIFPVKVEWTSTGPDENVNVYLESIEGNKRTPKKTVSSDVHSVVFQPDEVVQAAPLRGYKQENEIRAVVEWKNSNTRSSPKSMIVGITVSLNLYGTSIEHGEVVSTQFHTLFATIDNSTQALPRDYCLKGDFDGRTKRENHS